MITQNLRINQLSSAAYERYLAYLQTIDNKDVGGYGRFLADKVTVRFNNDAPMQGKAAVLEGLGAYWQSFQLLEHDLINIYGTDEQYVLEALNHYVRADGQPATVHAVAFTDLDEHGLVESIRIYQDVSPVFA